MQAESDAGYSSLSKKQWGKLLCVTKQGQRGQDRFQEFVDPFQSSFSANRILPPVLRFGRERVWWITYNYPTVLKEKNIEKQKEYNLRYLLAEVRTTRGKASDRLQQ
jgi:hypothetical protein